MQENLRLYRREIQTRIFTVDGTITSLCDCASGGKISSPATVHDRVPCTHQVPTARVHAVILHSFFTKAKRHMLNSFIGLLEYSLSEKDSALSYTYLT
jgi:hypothetical protein